MGSPHEHGVVEMPKELFDRLQKKRVPVDIEVLEALDYESGLRLASPSLGWHVAPSSKDNRILKEGLVPGRGGGVYVWTSLDNARWFKRLSEDQSGSPRMTLWEVDLKGLRLRRDPEAEDMSEWGSRFEEGEFGEAYIYDDGVVPSDRLKKKASEIRVARKYALKMAPTPGVQTVVTDKSQKNLPTDIDRENEVNLPPGSATPGGEGRMISQFSYNTPDSGSDIKPRTLGIPGEQYGHPSNDTYNTVSRRTMTGSDDEESAAQGRSNSYVTDVVRQTVEESASGEPLISQPAYGESDAALPRGDEDDEEGMEKEAYKRRWQTGKRQRRSRGTSRTKRRQYNRRNKQKRKMQSRRWRKKNRNNSAFKRSEKRRRSQNRTRRRASVTRVAHAHRVGSVLTVPDIAFIIGPKEMLGYVHSISPLSGMVTIELDESNVSQLDSLPVEVFLRMAVFLTEQDIDAFYDLVDVEIGPSAYEDLDEDLVRDCAKRYDRDPDADDFKDDCFELTDEYELSSMSPDQLEAVTSGVIQGFIEEGHARSMADADDPEIGDEYDPHLYYGEVDVER